MKCFDTVRRLVSLLIVAAACLAPAAYAGEPEHWKDTGFSINANGLTLRGVLEEFGRAYGVKVSVSAKGEQYMKGRLKADSGAEFLDRLTQPYRFRWFVYNEVLYVVPRDESTSMRLIVGEDAVQDAKAALVGLGLFDSRFGWGELPDEGVVIVSGPRAYVNLVRDVLLPNDEEKAKLRGRQIMVFRLKYASATDRVINSRDQQQTIPGVKTILNNLLFSKESGEKLAGPNSHFDVGSTKRSREGDRGRGGAREVGDIPLPVFGRAKPERKPVDDTRDEDRGDRKKEGSRDERPRIEADPSLNAIVIYDNVNKRDMYKNLIAELDIEPRQVEIEALIVDIDRNKLSELGVEWGARKGGTVGRVNASGGDSQGVDLPLPGSTLLISNAANFYLRLKAMENNGEARVLAKPTVLTLDNVAAVLDLSQTAYLPLVGERVADLANITAGTMLRVVPRILNEGKKTRVRMEIDIEDGSLTDPSLKSGVTRSTISTQAIVDLQQTLMIGGYHSSSVSNEQQKIPVLGDLPLLGGLFRQTTASTSSRERLFLITPRLSGTTGVAAYERSSVGMAGDRLAREDALASGQSAAADKAAADAIEEKSDKPAKRKVRKLRCARPKQAPAAAAPAQVAPTPAPAPAPAPVVPVAPPQPPAPPKPVLTF